MILQMPVYMTGIFIFYDLNYCYVAAQCPIPIHMAIHGDMGGNG
jgi:hypothetical protein